MSHVLSKMSTPSSAALVITFFYDMAVINSLLGSSRIKLVHLMLYGAGEYQLPHLLPFSPYSSPFRFLKRGDGVVITFKVGNCLYFTKCSLLHP